MKKKIILILLIIFLLISLVSSIYYFYTKKMMGMFSNENLKETILVEKIEEKIKKYNQEDDYEIFYNELKLLTKDCENYNQIIINNKNESFKKIKEKIFIEYISKQAQAWRKMSKYYSLLDIVKIILIISLILSGIFLILQIYYAKR